MERVQDVVVIGQFSDIRASSLGQQHIVDLIHETDVREGHHSLELLILAHDYEESSETVLSSNDNVSVILVRELSNDFTLMDLG